MHLLLSAEGSENDLRAEHAEAFPGASLQQVQTLLFAADFPFEAGTPTPRLAFARQCWPNARPAEAQSIRGWAEELVGAVAGVLPDDQPWSLHIEPHYGARSAHRMGARAWHSARLARHDLADPNAGEPRGGVAAEAGRHRCRLVRDAVIELLQKKRRHLLRLLRREPGAFAANESLVQLLLLAPDRGWLSVAPAPIPYERRCLLSPFPKGEVPVASDKAAPSRAFAKLVEAELRLGCTIGTAETCVDLGAAPGSWTYVAVSRGARVLAVDRAPLREDLMRSRLVEFQTGDAFRFQPRRPVDWLLCDVIAAPERTAELLVEWLRRGWCRHFVVTLKLKDEPGANVLAGLKEKLPALAHEWFLTRLCANKKEVCAAGSAR